MRAGSGTRSRHLAPRPAFIVFGILILLAGVGLTTVGGGRLLASAMADFTLAASPTTATAQQGQVATYTISETKQNGFKSTVTLSASGLPAGASATFSPQTLDTKTTSTIAITVGASTPITTASNPAYSITVSGAGGGLPAHTLTVSLTVTAPPPVASFTIAATPPSQTLLPGGTAQYTVTTTQVSGSGTVSLSVSGNPTGSIATFTPGSVPFTGSSSLQVATKNTTTAGTYSLTITGTSGTKVASVGVSLIVTATGKQFTISAPPVTLPGPGSQVALNLSLVNPNNQALQVTNLTAAVTSVTKTSANSARVCTPSDYAITQLAATRYPLIIGAGQTVSLATLLGVSTSSTSLPQLTMLNSPSNQEGCKGATIALSFSGAGQG
jgi:hypothetical protein